MPNLGVICCLALGNWYTVYRAEMKQLSYLSQSPKANGCCFCQAVLVERPLMARHCVTLPWVRGKHTQSDFCTGFQSLAKERTKTWFMNGKPFPVVTVDTSLKISQDVILLWLTYRCSWSSCLVHFKATLTYLRIYFLLKCPLYVYLPHMPVCLSVRFLFLSSLLVLIFSLHP